MNPREGELGPGAESGLGSPLCVTTQLVELSSLAFPALSAYSEVKVDNPFWRPCLCTCHTDQQEGMSAALCSVCSLN
jgi:hypothetical protein